MHKQPGGCLGQPDDVISREDYETDEKQITREIIEIEQAMDTEPEGLIEPLSEAKNFVNLAQKSFDLGSREEKREIIRTVSSNPELTNKKLRSVAKFPFSELEKLG